MAFKCGHCKERHDTIAEGRECAAKNQRKTIDGKVSNKYLHDALEEQSSELTVSSQKYLRDLIAQFGLVLIGGQTVETIDYRAGKKILSGLIDARRLKAMGKPYSLPDGVLHDPTVKTHTGERGPTPQMLPECPPGYYAVSDWTGKEEFKFFRVKTFDDGKWKGYTFVDQVIGGHPELPARGKFAFQAIEAILNMGTEAAGLLYAIKIRNCSNCNRHLTKKASRLVGLGRNCAYKKGKGEEWDALNYDFNDADAEDD